jgi:hypothetical protein
MKHVEQIFSIFFGKTASSKEVASPKKYLQFFLKLVELQVGFMEGRTILKDGLVDWNATKGAFFLL